MSLQSLHLSNEEMGRGQEAQATKCAQEDKLDKTQESKQDFDLCDKDTSLTSHTVLRKK